TATVPYAPASRAAGVSKYTFRKMLRLATDGLLSFSRAPLRLAPALGGAFAALGGVVGLAGGALALLGQGGIGWGWWLMATVLLVGGSVLAGLGVVGEYVG